MEILVALVVSDKDSFTLTAMLPCSCRLHYSFGVCLQSTINQRRWRNGHFFYLQLATVLALLLCFIPLETQGAPIADQSVQRRDLPSENRNLCQHHSSIDSLTCSYHDSCIESMFQCKSNGFQLSYALPRCQALRLLHTSNDSCPSCLKHQELVNWALETELCVQPRLEELATKWAENLSHLASPDPQHCLEYETEGLEIINECYNNNQQSLCNLLPDLENDILSDLETLVSSLTINDYYRPLVLQQIRNILRKCDYLSAEDISSITPEPNDRILFCVLSEDDNSDVTSIIAEKLNRPLEEFIYADFTSNLDRDSDCQTSSPVKAFVSLSTDFRLVQWNRSPSDNLNLSNFYKVQISQSSRVVFFDLKTETSLCGNGKREAGELCDTFAEIGVENYGCDTTCKPFKNYECSTDQLTISTCVPVTCGDGLRTSTEKCDDGNTDSDDGCSKECTFETDFECSVTPYNRTTICSQLPDEISSKIIPTTSISSQSLSSTSVLIVTSTPVHTPSETQILSEPTKEAYGHSIMRTSPTWSLIVSILALIVVTYQAVLR